MILEDMTGTADDALTTAIASRDPQGVRTALAGGADPNAKLGTAQALHIAALSGPLEILTALIDAGADVNAVGEGKDAPLHFACLGTGNKDCAAIVRRLIQAGAEVNAMGHKGYPLDMAALRRNTQAGVVLKEAGAKCSKENETWVRTLCDRPSPGR